MWLAMIEAAAGRPCPEAGGGMRGMFETMFLTMLRPALCPPLIITGRPGKIFHVNNFRILFPLEIFKDPLLSWRFLLNFFKVLIKIFYLKEFLPLERFYLLG